MAGGAAITVVTKSGTNALHGSAFAYHTNNHLSAKNFFFVGDRLPKNIRNMDGFTLGGPIIKNKLFFFGGWEGIGTREFVQLLHCGNGGAARLQFQRLRHNGIRSCHRNARWTRTHSIPEQHDPLGSPKRHHAQDAGSGSRGSTGN